MSTDACQLSLREWSNYRLQIVPDCAVSITAVPEALMTSLVQVYGQQLAA